MKLTVVGRISIADFVLVELAGQEIKSSLGAPASFTSRRLAGLRMRSARGPLKAVKSPLIRLTGQAIAMNEELDG